MTNEILDVLLLAIDHTCTQLDACYITSALSCTKEHDIKYTFNYKADFYSMSFKEKNHTHKNIPLLA